MASERRGALVAGQTKRTAVSTTNNARSAAMTRKTMRRPRCRADLIERRGHPVDVEDLAGGHGEQVAEQGDAGSGLSSVSPAYAGRDSRAAWPPPSVVEGPGHRDVEVEADDQARSSWPALVTQRPGVVGQDSGDHQALTVEQSHQDRNDMRQ